MTILLLRFADGPRCILWQSRPTKNGRLPE